MSMNDTVSAERTQIGFFGVRNAGKSSVVNAVTGQQLSLVSDIKGTTTDPVRKAMELLPLGPVVIVDTPGMDDEGTLGEMRVQKARQVLRAIDIAVLVADATLGLQAADQALLSVFQERNCPYIIAYNKSDLLEQVPDATAHEIYVSAKDHTNIHALKEMLAHLVNGPGGEKRIVADLLSPQDTVVLVVPIDSAAPKGRLILPQQQTLRDILDTGAIALVTRDTELTATLDSLKQKPRLLITDSQAFGYVSAHTPPDIPLTSFSILFARYRGDLETAILGAAQLDRLQDGDTVLISEGCTHHRQCEDIGTVKLPAWIRNYTKKDIRFAFTSGTEFPDVLAPYALVVHCGGCMLNEREMQYRIRHAVQSDVPITNYGIAIAQMHGVLRRSLSPFPALLRLLDDRLAL